MERCWVVIPLKAGAACKTRLADVLDAPARAALAAALAAHVVAVAAEAAGLAHVRLLGLGRDALPRDLAVLEDPGGGLNAALASARRAALRAGADRVLFLMADLPFVTADDVRMLLDTAPGVVAIAPDSAGQGTNTLSLPLPQAMDFGLHYGPASFSKHRAEAARLGLPAVSVRTPGLGFDIDEPADLARWRTETGGGTARRTDAVLSER